MSFLRFTQIKNKYMELVILSIKIVKCKKVFKRVNG
jgi:hypothetical protein